MTAAMAIKMGATTATLRRNARSCAAPLACQAAHRSSTLAASPAVVDEGASGTATDGTSMVMRPSLKGFGEGWARMAEGLRKADAISIFDQWECRCVCSVDSLRLLRGFVAFLLFLAMAVAFLWTASQPGPPAKVPGKRLDWAGIVVLPCVTEVM